MSLVRSFLALALAVAGIAPAHAFPDKPVRIVAPFAPGGNVDIHARAIGQALSEIFGQSFVIENRAGAGGLIGGELVAKAAPDGHTLLLGSNGSVTIGPFLYAKASYNPVRDFAPVSLLSITAMVIAVHPSVPARSLKDLVALARSRPGKLVFVSAGTGTSNHLAGELFQAMTDTRLLHVPYKGSGQALIDLVGGQVDLTFDQISSSLPHIRSGRLRAIAVTTLERTGVLPEVPTIDESGVKGYEASTFAGLLAPAATPREVIARLNEATVRALKGEALRSRIVSLGADPRPSTPEEAARFIRDDAARSAKLIKSAGLKLE